MSLPDSLLLHTFRLFSPLPPVCQYTIYMVYYRLFNSIIFVSTKRFLKTSRVMAKLWRFFQVLLLVATLSLPAFAQKSRIEGRVLDERTQEAVIGAEVSLLNEKTGAISDADGKFTIEVASLPATIAVSYIGYKTLEVAVYEYTEPITIELSENLRLLDEVVVIGYGTQKRKELTGAIASVSKESLSQIATSFDGLLGGSVAGLNVTQSDGQPGATSSIRIRGGNSINGGNEPLYVVDGIIIYNSNSSTQAGISRIEGGLNPLAAINPNDIESIEVLKDVSATAIYGSRGANGVIIITTKSGKKGRNNIEYQYTAGWQQVNKKLDLMNARQWGELYSEIASAQNISETGLTPEKVAQLGEGTDWQSAALRTAPTQNHQLTISGGDDKTRYLLSANYSDQDGILKNTGFRRYSGRFNFDRDLFRNFTVGLNVTASNLEQNGLSSYGGLYVNGVTNSLDYVLRIPQVVPIYDADGGYNYNNLFEKGDLRLGDRTVNALSDLLTNVSETKTNALIGNFYAKYAILPSLTAKISAGTNLNNTTQNFFAPASSAAGFLAKGYGSIGNKRTDSWQVEYTLNYTKRLSDHYIDVLGGYTTQTSNTRSATASSSNFANERLSYNSLQGGSLLLSPHSGGSESVLNSVLGRVNYSYRGRYNLTATLRSDGSSRFAKNHKWGYFPSVGLSWNINEEPFFKDNKTISDFKFRASTGTVGNQEIGDYRYEATYDTRRYSFSDLIVIGYGRSNAENPDLKWETTTQHNVGIDLSLFDHRLSFTADAYYKKTSDLLLNVPVEITTGFSSMLKNVGNVTNKGLEFEVKGTVIDRKDFNWALSANIAKNVNEVTSLGTLESFLSGNTIVQTGKPLGSFYSVVFDGIVQEGDDLSKVPAPSWKPKVEPGDVKYVDQDGDGKITQDADRVITGSRQPDFIYGFSTTLRYKSFSLFASIQGVEGNSVVNSLRQGLEAPTTSYNVLATLANRWTPSNPSNTIPKASITPATWLDTRYVEDGAYLKLKNVTLSYILPVKINSAPTTKFRLFASGQNLLTLTKYSGYDPEVSNGSDSGAYPTAKTFTFGVNISY
ncbi:Outer membrane cobalamin receptor protein, SusC/RagA family [Bacteroidales bacterium Barb7]|nr:Outer membrane cobalamin receptor protein, SusC/RagA family [Bacteroidales bacterium Barb7]